MQLAAYLICSLVAAAVFWRRPLFLALLAMTIWLLLPGSAATLVTGQTSGAFVLQPAAVLTLIGFVTQAFLRPRIFNAALAHRPEWSVLLAVVMTISLLIGIIAGLGSDSIAAAINQVVGPVLLFFLLGSSLLERPSELRTLRDWFLLTATIQACLALLQLFLQSPLFYTSQFQEQAFFRQDLNRWMGTLDHPLILSYFLVVSMFLLASLRRWWLVLLLTTVLGAGVLVTQSRTGVVMAVVAVFYIVATVRLAHPAQRFFILLPIVFGAVIAANTGILDAIQARVLDDSGSTSARADALGYFVDHIREFVWLGQGLNGSFAVSDNAGLGSSFESAALMYSVDIGVFPTLMYFGVMVATVVRSFRASLLPGPTGAAFAALVVPQTFSALSGNTAAPMIAWAAFAAAGFCAVGPRAQRHLDIRTPMGAGRGHAATTAHSTV